MKPSRSGHAIVLASWENNSEQWLDGRFFELRSKKPWLQETVGNGGTLWIVVSRPTSGGRLYTVSFRLNECRSHTYRETVKFGCFAVLGDKKRSKFFAAADARLLLLALRFEPTLPISGPADNQVSNSIRVPRCLSPSDVQLLEDNVARWDRWSAFISYRHDGELKLADALSDALQRAGISVFRDLEGLRGGDRWWPTLKRAITRSQRLIVLIGPTTHESIWVRREIQHALDNGVWVVPLLAGGKFDSWGTLSKQLATRHALDLSLGLENIVARLK